jgi:hypothetical protein
VEEMEKKYVAEFEYGQHLIGSDFMWWRCSVIKCDLELAVLPPMHRLSLSKLLFANSRLNIWGGLSQVEARVNYELLAQSEFESEENFA